VAKHRAERRRKKEAEEAVARSRCPYPPATNRGGEVFIKRGIIGNGE
jgi:hypothetical protein